MEDEAQLKLFFWIGTAVMIFLALGVIFISIIYKARVDRMNRKRSESLLKASLNSEKTERQRIASDLHDSVSGDLSAVQNFIALLNTKETDVFKKEILNEVENVLSHALTNVQNISYNLMPPMLESYGLIPTLRSFFERIRKLHTITVTEKYSFDAIDISSTVSYELYRVIQEFTTNMIKHGKCDEITLLITENENSFIFELKDNGTPFDFYSSLKLSRGMGLKNILSRINHINAKLKQLPSTQGNTLQIILNTTPYAKNRADR